eukprot:4082517-Lingulodinium_polyedra.AAC.1
MDTSCSSPETGWLAHKRPRSGSQVCADRHRSTRGLKDCRKRRAITGCPMSPPRPGATVTS